MGPGTFQFVAGEIGPIPKEIAYLFFMNFCRPMSEQVGLEQVDQRKSESYSG